jgi:SHS2 domain-containing protein
MTEKLKDDIVTDDIKQVEEDKKVENVLNVEEDINAIFSGESLSEEFKTNAKAIFEAAIIAKVNTEKEKLEEEYSTKLQEEVASINENLVTKVDEYLEYVVSEWMEENKLAIESGIKSEIVEDFMVGLKNLFTEHYIDIPEEKVDMVEELAIKVQELEGELDKVVTENVNLNSAIGNYKKDSILSDVAEGLSEVQSAKLQSLAEGIEFVSEEDYKEKLNLTKKKYFSEQKDNNAVTSAKDQFATVDSSEEQQLSPIMENYVKNISKILKK